MPARLQAPRRPRRRQRRRRHDPRTRGNTGRNPAFRTERTASRTGTCVSSRYTPSPAACTISCITVAIPPRVGSRMKRSPLQRASSSEGQHARRIGLQVAAQAELLAGEHDRDAVIAHRAADDDRVAGADLAHAEPQVRVAHADTAGIEVDAATLAAPHDLGVAGGAPRRRFPSPPRQSRPRRARARRTRGPPRAVRRGSGTSALRRPPPGRSSCRARPASRCCRPEIRSVAR